MAKLTLATELESVLENRPVLVRFRQFLDSIYSAENLTFWLQAEIYKYLPEEELIDRAKQMYQVYFSGSPEGTPINLDDMSQELELKKRMETPARDTFLNVQGIVWGLLKFECFARFKLSPLYGAKLTKQDELALKDDATVQLLDEFLDIRRRERKGKLKAPAMPVYEKELNLDENLYDQPDIEEIFDDEELMLAFREYLYQTRVQESLAFWLEAELFRRIDDGEQRVQRAQLIIQKFCLGDSPYVINCEESILSKIIAASQKPSPATFRLAQKMIWRGLKNEWFPQFCTSELYKEFDKQELEFEKSTPDRSQDRRNTMDCYDEIVALKARLQSVGRDFVQEIAVDDALAPAPLPVKVTPVRVVPVQVKTFGHKPSSSKLSVKTHKSSKSTTSELTSESSSEHNPKKLKKDKKDKKEKSKEKEKKKDKRDPSRSLEKRSTLDSTSRSETFTSEEDSELLAPLSSTPNLHPGYFQTMSKESSEDILASVQSSKSTKSSKPKS